MEQQESKNMIREIEEFLDSIWLKGQIKNMTLPVIVTLTRIAPRRLDSDNLQSGFKGIRDLLAQLLVPGTKPGQADSDPSITWRYAQETGGVKVYACRIEIEHTPCAD